MAPLSRQFTREIPHVLKNLLASTLPLADSHYPTESPWPLLPPLNSTPEHAVSNTTYPRSHTTIKPTLISLIGIGIFLGIFFLLFFICGRRRCWNISHVVDGRKDIEVGVDGHGCDYHEGEQGQVDRDRVVWARPVPLSPVVRLPLSTHTSFSQGWGRNGPTSSGRHSPTPFPPDLHPASSTRENGRKRRSHSSCTTPTSSQVTPVDP